MSGQQDAAELVEQLAQAVVGLVKFAGLDATLGALESFTAKLRVAQEARR